MDKPEKKQKIQWDEETIAEHDKERGSRQKIDEAPTPFRYQSESDQSECESSDAETLAKKDLEDMSEEAAASGAPRSGKKKKNVLFNSNQNKISDSWETINAKLQYEKHLQDAGSAPMQINGVIGDNVQRREFYQHSGSNSNSNIASQYSQQHSPKVTLAGAGKILDLQTNFGEIANPALNSAPAAFSPQFTKKSYRTAGSSGSKNASSSGVGGAGGSGAMQTCSDDADGTEKGLRPEVSPVRGVVGGEKKNGFSPEKPPKTVFIRSVVDVAAPVVEDASPTPDDHVASAGSAEASSGSYGGGGGAGSMSCGSASGDDESSGGAGNKKQFLNKRAGHYNEYKVLQAMRAKLAAEQDDDEDD